MVFWLEHRQDLTETSPKSSPDILQTHEAPKPQTSCPSRQHLFHKLKTCPKPHPILPKPSQKKTSRNLTKPSKLTRENHCCFLKMCKTFEKSIISRRLFFLTSSPGVGLARLDRVGLVLLDSEDRVGWIGLDWPCHMDRPGLAMSQVGPTCPLVHMCIFLTETVCLSMFQISSLCKE